MKLPILAAVSECDLLPGHMTAIRQAWVRSAMRVYGSDRVSLCFRFFVVFYRLKIHFCSSVVAVRKSIHESVLNHMVRTKSE